MDLLELKLFNFFGIKTNFTSSYKNVLNYDNEDLKIIRARYFFPVKMAMLESQELHELLAL